MPLRVGLTKTTQDQNDAELVQTIEKLFDDPIKRRALYFNLKYKEVSADLKLVVDQRNKVVADNTRLQLELTKQHKIKIALVIVGFSLGLTLGFGLAWLGAKILTISHF